MDIFRFGNDTFDNILRLQRALERNLGQPLGGRDWFSAGRGVYPALNVFEDDNALVVMAEVPGFDKSSFDIKVQNDRLYLTGERLLRKGEEDRSYHRRERQEGAFRRVLRIPFPVDAERTKATYEAGILTIRLEKAEAAKPRQITVS